MVGNHRTIYNESLIYLSLKLNPFFPKKVNPFSIKSEPILQNEPIRILYPFHQLLTNIKRMGKRLSALFLIRKAKEKSRTKSDLI